MGQRELLLIVLGVIVIGIAVAFALDLFRAGAINNKRDLIVSESANLAATAIGYYNKPREMGGGGRSFLNWVIPGNFRETSNGYYTAETFHDSIIITGTGTEVVTGSDSIQVKTTVLSNDFLTIVIK
jgi:hypothetical protein